MRLCYRRSSNTLKIIVSLRKEAWSVGFNEVPRTLNLYVCSLSNCQLWQGRATSYSGKNCAIILCSLERCMVR